MSDIKLKQLERKAVDRVRQTFATLRDNEILPEKMTAPIGEVTTDIGVYTFELRVARKVTEPHKYATEGSCHECGGPPSDARHSIKSSDDRGHQ